MLLSEVIVRIRQACPIFERRVQGTQSFVAASAETAQVDVPCCFVVPLYGTAPAMDQTFSQKVSENFATVIALDNSVKKIDGKGMSAEMALSTARSQLTNALLGWVSLAYPTMDGVNYSRDQHLLMNNSRIWHQFQWFGTYYVQANLNDNDQWNKIASIINGYFPMVDPATIQSIMTSNNPFDRGSVGDPDKYHEVLSLLTGDGTVPWIKELKDKEPSSEPGYISNGRVFAPVFPLPSQDLDLGEQPVQKPRYILRDINGNVLFAGSGL